jgi:hypothetical protein
MRRPCTTIDVESPAGVRTDHGSSFEKAVIKEIAAVSYAVAIAEKPRELRV